MWHSSLKAYSEMPEACPDACVEAGCDSLGIYETMQNGHVCVMYVVTPHVREDRHPSRSVLGGISVPAAQGTSAGHSAGWRLHTHL